jgi:cytolysin-activating lysine-acyltransferase
MTHEDEQISAAEAQASAPEQQDEMARAQGGADEQAPIESSGSDGGGGNEQPSKTVAAVLGEMAWLLSQSNIHRYNLFVGDLEWLIMAPIMHNQYRLFYANGQPIGCALWAFASELVEQRLASGGRIAAGEWRGGDRLWLVELIAPFGRQDAMLEDLAATALADRRFRFLRTNAQGRRETVTLAGQNVADGT